MKKTILASTLALALIGSSFVYAQNSASSIEPISIISSKPADVMPARKCEVPGLKLGLGDGSRNKRDGEVKKLQQQLIERGHLSGSATGYFGPLTFAAVKKLQKEEGVSMTGYVGPLTLEKIKNKCGSVPVYVCDYAAPPSGCSYVAGPKYNSKTQCGMVLSCDGNTLYEPPANCSSWYDGCNTCGRQSPGGPAFCTLRACISPNDGTSVSSGAKCNAYFDTGKTCNAFGKTYTEGQSTSCIEASNGQKACIADAAHVCRSGVWKIEGGLPPVKPFFPIKPTEPIACTMEARLCADGSMMPRDSQCGWHPEQCR